MSIWVWKEFLQIRFQSARFKENSEFLNTLVTMAETWVHFINPETKQQSMERKHRSSPKTTTFNQFFGVVQVSTSLIPLRRENNNQKFTTVDKIAQKYFEKKYVADRKESCSCNKMRLCTSQMLHLTWFHLTSIYFPNWKRIWEDANFLPIKKFRKPLKAGQQTGKRFFLDLEVLQERCLKCIWLIGDYLK